MTPSTDPPAVPYLAAPQIEALGYRRAADAITRALTSGLDTAAASPRSIVAVEAGQLLLMPAEAAGFVGVKVASVAPANPAKGLPRIQGSFLLMDADTLAPLALMDGIALTTLRTPAVSAAAAAILQTGGSAHAVVFGTGPQAAGHIRALHEAIGLTKVTLVARDRRRAEAVAAALAEELAIAIRAGAPLGVEGADLVVCATTARSPLFRADQLRRGALVILVGSHEPDAVEMDPAILADAQLFVEDRATALREAGEVVQARAAGHLADAQIGTLAELVIGARLPDQSRTRVFKSVGMAWEDVAVAAAVWAAGLAMPQAPPRDRCQEGQ